jgi:hypothetical protein
VELVGQGPNLYASGTRPAPLSRCGRSASTGAVTDKLSASIARAGFDYRF